ncbi:hypothetical protein FOZ60_000841 [Perkinsus olseni]|uniref:Uncharacterized protein n=1 Tax=Perkinsus olseni TaxID=32597 RepID=A0A7J6PJT8_PEROL|nr:hypothetical protein FOZ60_000841 [Perkinsus olseni]
MWSGADGDLNRALNHVLDSPEDKIKRTGGGHKPSSTAAPPPPPPKSPKKKKHHKTSAPPPAPAPAWDDEYDDPFFQTPVPAAPPAAPAQAALPSTATTAAAPQPAPPATAPAMQQGYQQQPMPQQPGYPPQPQMMPSQPTQPAMGPPSTMPAQQQPMGPMNPQGLQTQQQMMFVRVRVVVTNFHRTYSPRICFSDFAAMVVTPLFQIQSQQQQLLVNLKYQLDTVIELISGVNVSSSCGSVCSSVLLVVHCLYPLCIVSQSRGSPSISICDSLHELCMVGQVLANPAMLQNPMLMQQLYDTMSNALEAPATTLHLSEKARQNEQTAQFIQMMQAQISQMLGNPQVAANPQLLQHLNTQMNQLRLITMQHVASQNMLANPATSLSLTSPLLDKSLGFMSTPDLKEALADLSDSDDEDEESDGEWWKGKSSSSKKSKKPDSTPDLSATNPFNEPEGEDEVDDEIAAKKKDRRKGKKRTSSAKKIDKLIRKIGLGQAPVVATGHPQSSGMMMPQTTPMGGYYPGYNGLPQQGSAHNFEHDVSRELPDT